MPTCPPGFSNFIHTCVEIPSTLPQSDFETAASTSGCLVDGKQILHPQGFLVFEALKHFFLDIELTSSFWIGKWTDVQKDPYHVQVEWSEDGKAAAGECVVADVENDFKWTRSDCSITAAYLCTIWRPNCPNGYTFVPSAGKASCFKITGKTEYEDSNIKYQSISTANKMCLSDGTSLAAPETKEEIKAVWDWIGRSFLEKHGVVNAPSENFEAFMGLRSFKETLTIPSSCSSCQWKDHYYSPWSKDIPSDVSAATLGVSLGGVHESCTHITRNSGSGTLSNKMCYKNEVASNPVSRAICEYRECRISEDQACIFPFRVGGRLYDKCTTIGTEKNTPWCSLKVDEYQNHIPGNEVNCPSDCLFSDCPVGFWPHLGTCLQDSSTFPSDAQVSVTDAEVMCLNQGARLYQPRSTRSLNALEKRTQQFYDQTYKTGQAGWSGILGWAALQETAIGITMEYMPGGFKQIYRDGSTVPAGLSKDSEGLVWKVDYPIINESLACINFVEKGLIVNNECDGYSDGVAPYLSYICEAKPFTTIDGDDSFKACHFPFKITPASNWSHSCVYDKDKSGASKVWCATEVDDDGVVKDGKTGICEDERNTAYAGPGIV